jgi:hypothetical protein
MSGTCSMHARTHGYQKSTIFKPVFHQRKLIRRNYYYYYYYYYYYLLYFCKGLTVTMLQDGWQTTGGSTPGRGKKLLPFPKRLDRLRGRFSLLLNWHKKLLRQVKKRPGREAENLPSVSTRAWNEWRTTSITHGFASVLTCIPIR